WNVQRQRFPRTVAVACPHRRIALNAGVTGSRDNKWPAVRLQTRQAFVRRACHQKRKDVAILCVSCLLAFIVTDYIELVLAGLIDKIRWLVHIVPDPRNAIVGVRAMQIAPPAPRLRQSKIDEDTVAGPDPGIEELATLATLKIVSLLSLIEDIVTLTLRLKLRL